LRGVPRFLLLVNGKVAWSVIGTNDYERVFKPAIKDAVSRRNGRS